MVSALLRSFMVKFTTWDPDVTAPIWGPMYAGGEIACTVQENKLRDHILHGSMPTARANKVLASCVALKAWPTRLQFIEALAALACLHANDMQKKIEGTKIPIRKMLYNITAPDKAEWLFNNLRYRQVLAPAVRVLMASGTTANEALHAEINTWFRQIQAMHRSTLELKLRIQSLGKLLAHQVALYSPTCAQLPQMLLGWKRLATVIVHLKARVQTCECVVLFPFSHLVLRVSLQQRETSTNWGLSSYTLENAWELLRSAPRMR